MKINWKLRVKNPVFWVQVGGAVLMTALTYNSMAPSDLTTWDGVIALMLGVVTNPFLLGSCAFGVWNAINDPTTKGISDSGKALDYETPAPNVKNTKE